MKNLIIKALLTIFPLLFFTVSSNAQILRKIKNTVETKIVDKVNQSVNKGLDKTGGLSAEAVSPKTSGENGMDETGASDPSFTKVARADYKSYDFIPGDQIIFQPDLSGEADAELPARFIIKKGNAEIQSYEGEKILHLDAGGYITITPLMDNEDYLPEQYTVEFDMMYENDKETFNQLNDFNVNFYKREESNLEGYPLFHFNIHSNERIALGDNQVSGQLAPDALKKDLQTNDVWHHIAIYVRQNIAKAYINQYRVAASNTMPSGADKLAIRTDGRYGFKIKNFRLAAGGDDKYNKIVTDGKFITHGIQFDIAKSTIKPESMGTLNEVAKLMNEHNDLSFQIQGHTDSDGSDEANLKLSQERADSVKEKLTALGIDESRLSTKGMGETKPLDTNDTAEGKANNRRVEFVKM